MYILLYPRLYIGIYDALKTRVFAFWPLLIGIFFVFCVCMTNHVQGQQVTDPRSQSVLTKKSRRFLSFKRRRNKLFSGTQKPGRTLRKNTQTNMERGSNRRHTNTQNPYRTLNKREQIRQERATNIRHTNTQNPYRTLRKNKQLKIERKSNRRQTNSEFPYRTLSKNSQLKMERATNHRHTNTQFPYRTLGKRRQIRMERRSNRRQTSSEYPNRTLNKAEQIRQERATNRRLTDYNVYYLNSRNERRARIKSIFYPNKYPANSPEEQKIDARNTSRKLADYKGELAVRRSGKNMHPSAKWLGGQSSKSLAAKNRYRKRMLRQNRSNSKSNLPIYMRKEPKKPKYDKDIARDFWND